VIRRDAGGLFWKMFTGMYIAFLIAYVCFYIHPDGIDSRFGLSVGSLFAVIGNKYIIDSSFARINFVYTGRHIAWPDIIVYFMHHCGYRLLIDNGEKGQTSEKI
jgi:hypothetical protein